MFSVTPKPTDRRTTQTYDDQRQEIKYSEYFRFVDAVLTYRKLVVIWHCST